jgi:1,2-phenylacetyl-CoA epoxidase PaaB subunit
MQAEREHEYYQVFARRKADEPLQHIGTVGASEPDDAEVFAFKLYDQWRWSEMFVAPSRRLIQVVRPE